MVGAHPKSVRVWNHAGFVLAFSFVLSNLSSDMTRTK